MSLPVVWSPDSKDEYAILLDYIETGYGLDAALKFLDKTDAVLDAIAIFPESFPSSAIKPGVRKAIISKQTSLFYRIEAENIQLLHFWDNRQDPVRLKDLL